MTKPRLSVAIRSYNRLPSLVVLIDHLLAQAHDAFEIVVVDQSSERPEAASRRLAELEADPRVRVLRYPALGGARARNVAVSAARGDLVVFVDDDDLPIGTDWLTQMEAPFNDPSCLGITCRHRWGTEDRPSAMYLWLARNRCMRYSTLLKTPATYGRYDQRVCPVDYVHGTGSAIRRSAFERFGGWDTDTPIEDELSFSLRARATKRPEEYFAFVPEPQLLRGLDIGGGLAKRSLTSGAFYGKFMTFVHKVLGRYRPWRVRGLYPLYVLAGVVFVLEWIWSDSRRHSTAVQRLGGSAMFLALLPYYAVRSAAVSLGRLDGAAVPGSDYLRAQPSPVVPLAFGDDAHASERS